jgi:hypothetical protein
LITDYIVICVLFLIAGLSYEGDKMCLKEFKGFRYKDVVVSYGFLVEAVGISSVLVYVLLVETIAQVIWIFTCVLCLGILVVEAWKVRK